jgi:2-polyprenyl-3-methyl-5-hydroxy-6-metoxy-1,4-benzoquinol methylase
MSYENINEGTRMMVNNIDEENFFLSHLTKDMVVLEFGCGESTLTILPLVKELHSVEHNSKWAEEVAGRLDKQTASHYSINPMVNHGIVYQFQNMCIHNIPPNKEPSADYDDGTYEDFKDYVNVLDRFKKELFDIIFIDGRARVACAAACVDYLKPGGLIFIHDYFHPTEKYRRREYECVEEFLEKTGQVFAIARFVPKKDTIVISQKDMNSFMEEGKEDARIESDLKYNMLVDKTTCWYQDSVVEEMNRFYDQHVREPEVRNHPHFTAFKTLLRYAELDAFNMGKSLVDLGCGGAAISDYCEDWEYSGADLKHIVIGCAMRNYPDKFYRICDVMEEDISWIAQFDMVVVNGLLDIMQYPLTLLNKILQFLCVGGYLIIHRQEITESGETHTIVNGSYGGETYHSIISRNDFNTALHVHSCSIVQSATCGFSNWENNGSSFLIKKGI